jgi:2-phosphosulfolactate phosphatase
VEISILKGHNFPEAKGLCVVIDVLRAFTTAAFAFASGAKEIIFVSTPEEAFKKHQSDPSLLLMGEQEGQRINGFHFENSPSEIQKAYLIEKRIIQRTSSGTQGVIGCRHASNILIASFVVAEATVKRILDLNPSHVTFIATGRTNGDEDMALAEYLQSKLVHTPIDLDLILNRVRYSPVAKRMIEGRTAYENGAYDLELALKVDYFPFAMEVSQVNEELIGRSIKV